MGNVVQGEWQRYGMECPLAELMGTPARDRDAMGKKA